MTNSQVIRWEMPRKDVLGPLTWNELCGRPDPHVMDGSIDRTPGTLQHVDLEHPMVSQGNTVSPLQLAWSSDISTVEVSRPQDDVVDGPSIRPLIPQRTDCETLIVTLQLLRLYLLKLSS